VALCVFLSDQMAHTIGMSGNYSTQGQLPSSFSSSFPSTLPLDEAEEEEEKDSLSAKIEGDPLNTQHAQQHRTEPKEEKGVEEVVVEEVGVFTCEYRGGSAQRNTRNIDPFKPQPSPVPCAVPFYSSAVAFIHTTLPAPSRMGRTSRSVQVRRDHSSLGPKGSICLLCDCGHAVCLVILR